MRITLKIKKIYILQFTFFEPSKLCKRIIDSNENLFVDRSILLVACFFNLFFNLFFLERGWTPESPQEDSNKEALPAPGDK